MISVLRASSIFGINLKVRVCRNQHWRVAESRSNNYLENGTGWNAMSEKVIELSSDLQDAGRAALGKNLVGDLRDESLPIRRWNGCLLCDLIAVKGQHWQKWHVAGIVTSEHGQLQT
jgi:hypothetical protein